MKSEKQTIESHWQVDCRLRRAQARLGRGGVHRPGRGKGSYTRKNHKNQRD
ncbi:MAG: hypothetical protein OXD01_02610 [Gammaproteobacteria bacterium]|nr:hypothetical protein [Gammaproteobacteria bacterium]